MAQPLTREALLALLITQCEQSGGIRAWGRARGIVPSLVSMTIKGERPIGETIANALGYLHVDLYVPMRGDAASARQPAQELYR